jgi:hypothetical protein
VDEKWVLVPKNDKPAGKRKRWMVGDVAGDEVTADWLHIAIYPYCTRASAQAFLLALRAKGDPPEGVVTDLREDYGLVIAEVMPGAEHPECLFHADQAGGRGLREVYGSGYEEEWPEVAAWRQGVREMLQARTKRTAQRRYEGVRGQRAEALTAHLTALQEQAQRREESARRREAELTARWEALQEELRRPWWKRLWPPGGKMR